jgi:hypothetical protein
MSLRIPIINYVSVLDPLVTFIRMIVIALIGDYTLPRPDSIWLEINLTCEKEQER